MNVSESELSDIPGTSLNGRLLSRDSMHSVYKIVTYFNALMKFIFELIVLTD